MKTLAAGIGILIILLTSSSYSQEYQLQVGASAHSVQGDFSGRRALERGYLKGGIGGIYSDDDEKTFKYFNGRLVVGSESFFPNLKCELGFKGIYARIENYDVEVDASAVAFTGYAGYTLQRDITPIPIEFWVDLAGSPTPMSFSDLRNYYEVSTGVAFYIVNNAAITASYRYIRFNIDDTPTWDFSDNAFAAGLSLKF